MLKKNDLKNLGAPQMNSKIISQPQNAINYEDEEEEEVKTQLSSNQSFPRKCSNPPSVKPNSRGGIGSKGNINQGVSSGGDLKQGNVRRLNSNSREQMRTSLSRQSQKGDGIMQNSQNDGRIQQYTDDEENLICPRFPHLNYCGCKQNLLSSKDEGFALEVIPGIYIGDLQTGFCTKKLLFQGITHILNVTSTEYQQRDNYFQYLNIDVFDQSDEDIKKHFRISNRFIKNGLEIDGKILIHSIEIQSLGPAFALAYLINHQKIPLKSGIEILKEKVQNFELSPQFYKQLERYDLEKLALVTLKQKEQ